MAKKETTKVWYGYLPSERYEVEQPAKPAAGAAKGEQPSRTPIETAGSAVQTAKVVEEVAKVRYEYPIGEKGEIELPPGVTREQAEGIVLPAKVVTTETYQSHHSGIETYSRL